MTIAHIANVIIAINSFITKNVTSQLSTKCLNSILLINTILWVEGITKR